MRNRPWSWSLRARRHGTVTRGPQWRGDGPGTPRRHRRRATGGVRDAAATGARGPGWRAAGLDPGLLRVGARGGPLLRSIGVAGYYAALLVALVAGLRAGVHPIVVVGLSAAAAASFFLWGLIRRAITGRESLVLL